MDSEKLERVDQLIELQDYDGARSLGEELLLSSEPNSDLYALLGSIELQCGNGSIARQYLLEALRLAPNSLEAKESLSYLDALELQFSQGKYIHQWLRWRSQHLIFPRVIHLETVGRCNAKCNFCPHSQLERKFEEMKDELFLKIIHEASRFPAGKFSGFAMHAVNEPFMDRKIFARLEIINRELPNASISINTNMNVLPQFFFQRLRNIHNISEWNVSLNAANQQEYEDVMRIKFDRTVTNIRLLLEENRRSKLFEGPLRLSRVMTHDARDENFNGQCKTLFPDFVFGSEYVTVMLGRANWIGDISHSTPRFMHYYPCHQWMNMTIHCTGVVAHCCVDAKGHFPFGNINNQSLLEVYNSPHWKHLRSTVSRRDAVFPCKTCDLC